MAALGIFTHTGLRATSKIWGKAEFVDRERRTDAFELWRELIGQLDREGLAGKRATGEQARVLVADWQMPMHSLDFSIILVSVKELESERQNELASLVL